MSLVSLGLLLAITFFVGTLVLFVLVPRLIRCARDLIVTEERAEKKRKQKIEKWLITKTVPCRALHESTHGISSSDTVSEAADAAVDEEAAPQNDDDDEDDAIGAHDCLICMEGFAPCESVSFSIHCNHVFHHDCLAEWLLKHSDCPYCRRTVLPEKKLSRQHWKMLAAEQRHKSDASKFTLEEGLVVVVAAEQEEEDAQRIGGGAREG